MPFTLKAEPPLTERDVTAQITGYLRAHGWRVWRMQGGQFAKVFQPKGKPQEISRFKIGEDGMPDWLAMRPELPLAKTVPGYCRVLWLEIKAPGRALRKTTTVTRRNSRARAGFIRIERKGQDQYLHELRIQGFEAEHFDCYETRDGGKRPFLPWYEERFA